MVRNSARPKGIGEQCVELHPGKVKTK